MFNYKPSLLASAVLASSLVLSGCLESTSDETQKEVDTTTSSFEFSVTNPESGNLASNFFSRSAKQLLGMFIPEAHASLGDQNIQVAIVDYNGVVTQLVTPIEPLKQESNGTYVVILEGGVRLDCVLLVTLDGPSDIKVGDRIDDSGALYTPTVDTSEPLDIDLASTIAFDLFIEEVESFENITPSEVDRLIEGAQEIINDLGVTAVDTEALTDLISAELSNYVKTETLLAELSNESESGEQASTGTIETDRAKIKGFFDDINTLAVVLPDEYYSGKTDGTFDQLKSDTETAQAVLEGADTTLDDLASLQATLQAGLEGYQLGSADLNISDVFSGDNKANLSGLVALTNTSASFTLNGTYGSLSTVNLNIAANFSSTTNTPVSFSISGQVVSTDATIELSNGLIELHSSETVSETIVKLDKTEEEEIAADTELSNKIRTANANLSINLIVHKDGQDLSQFTGMFEVEAIRSSKDYIAFEFEEDGETPSEATAFYNLKSLALEGRFTVGENSIKAKVSAKQNNAADYAPLTQELVEGTVYNNLFSYDYNGTNSFVLNTPEHTRTYNADNNHNYKVLSVARNVRDNISSGSYASFEEYIQSIGRVIYTYNYDESGSYISTTEISGSSLQKGENISLTQDGNAFTYTYTDTSLIISAGKSADGSQKFRSYEFESNVDGVITVKTREYYASVRMNFSSPEEYMVGYHGFAFETEELYRSFNINFDNIVKGENLVINADVNYAYSYSEQAQVSNPEPISITYNYSNEKFETTNLGENNVIILFTGVEEYTGLKIENQFEAPGFSDTLPFYMSYQESKGTFEEYLNNLFFEVEYNNWYWLDSIGTVTFDFTDMALTTGTGTSIPAEIVYLESLEDYENATNFREYTIAVELESNIAGIGSTVITANLERTGYSNGVVSLKLSHTNENNLLSDVIIMAAYGNNNLGSVNISNSDGFVISKDDVIDGNEAIELTFGLETATVISTNTGIKVTYSDGTFDLY